MSLSQSDWHLLIRVGDRSQRDDVGYTESLGFSIPLDIQHDLELAPSGSVERQVALVSCCPLGYENEADIQTEKQLAKLPKVDCKVCSADIGAFYDLSAEVVRVNATLIKQAAFAAGAKLLNPGRIVVLRDGVGPPVSIGTQ
jgi:hypothetical protein